MYEQKQRGLPQVERYPWIPKRYLSRPMEHFLGMYFVITGFVETNPNAVFHHVAAQYGPDCPNCAKPLRTKLARYCAACGFGKEDFVGEETLPLVERRRQLFM